MRRTAGINAGPPAPSKALRESMPRTTSKRRSGGKANAPASSSRTPGAQGLPHLNSAMRKELSFFAAFSEHVGVLESILMILTSKGPQKLDFDAKTIRGGGSGGRSPPGLLRHVCMHIMHIKIRGGGSGGRQPPRTMHVCMHIMHIMHAYYACIICMHAYYACMHIYKNTQKN